MKILVILSAAILLTGCVNFPKTEQALAQTGTKAPLICSSLPIEKLTQEVEGYLAHCFRRRDIKINGANVTTIFSRSKHATQNGMRFLVALPHKTGLGYLLAVDVEKSNGECNATISGYSYNFMWARHFTKLETVSKGEKASCPL